MKNQKQYHLMQMSHAKGGLGISGLLPKDKDKILLTGSFEECVSKKKDFIENPQLINNILKAKEDIKEKAINKLIKQHKK